MRPNKNTPIGTTVVYDPPGIETPIAERPRGTFLGIVNDDAEPGAYCWVANRPVNEPLRQVKPEVTSEYTADLLIVQDEKRMLPMIPFELLRVAQGHPMTCRMFDGEEVLVRIPTVEEYQQMQADALERIRENFEGPPPAPTAMIAALVKPLPEVPDGR